MQAFPTKKHSYVGQAEDTADSFVVARYVAFLINTKLPSYPLKMQNYREIDKKSGADA
jgi:hypothetical protein